MASTPAPRRPLGRTGLAISPIVFGTSCLGNLYAVVPEETKRAVVAEIFRHSAMPVLLDSAGKYGAGLALEVIGRSLRALSIPPDQVLISNKLGWYRVPLHGPEPTFERGVWAGIEHDAEARISYEGILECERQGRALLGEAYAPAFVSLHDPDEYLAGASGAEDRARRLREVLDAYRALLDLKATGAVRAVGVGAKDWRIIREIADHVALDWVMLACSLTVYSHPPELLAFVAHLQARGVGVINSAVFHAGFLTGGEWFDYRRPDPVREAPLFAWRRRFLDVCQRERVKPADVCVQFGLAVPGVAAVALNTGRPERIKDNVDSATNPLSPTLWTALKDEGLLQADFPFLG
jgi:D-threo-aldose 1-dehydrogenase